MQKTSLAKRLRKGIFGLIVIGGLLVCSTLAGYAFIHLSQKNTLEQQALLLSDLEQALSFSQKLQAASTKLKSAKTYEDLEYFTQTVRPALLTHIKNLKLKLLLNIIDENIDTTEFDLFTLEKNLLNRISLIYDTIILNEAKIKSFIEKREEFNHNILKLQSLSDDIDRFIEEHSINSNLNFYRIVNEKNEKLEDLRLREIYEKKQRIVELSFSINQLFNQLAQLENTRSEDAVNALRNQFELELRTLSASIVSIENNQPALDFTRLLLSKTSNKGNIFNQRNALLNSEYDKNISINKLADLALDIERTVSEFQQGIMQVNALNNEYLYQRTLNTIIVVSIVFLMALFFYARLFGSLIFNQVVLPILQMTRLTQRLAEGDLEIEIPEYNSHEMSNMTQAIDVFRQNALALEKTNQKLRIANKDVEEFAYAASHDLKSPLRGIANLANFLEEDLQGKLDADNQEHLSEIQRRASRLETLLTDLLTYARCGSEMTATEITEPRCLIEDTFSLLNINDAFTLSLECDLKVIRIHATPFQQVLHNMIGNAIKHHDIGKGVISVGIKIAAQATANDSQYYHIWIEDDGKGIEEKYHQKIFKLFQVLQPRDVTEGSGMGLALVSKIINNYGGNIKVTSNPNEKRGCRFDIQWPVPR